MRPKKGYIKLFKTLFTKEDLIRLLNVRLKEEELDAEDIARIYTEVTSDEKLDSILNDITTPKQRRGILSWRKKARKSLMEIL